MPIAPTPLVERPPRDNLIRMLPRDLELRDAAASDSLPHMVGHFAVFNQWTEIDSMFEGHFLERIAPGAFAKTFAENRLNIRVTFNHGMDPQLGDKVLGMPDVLEEDETGARYDVPLFATSYNDDLLPGLKAGAYGSSFRFRVTKEDFDHKPKKSAHNPDKLPERTIHEVQLFEFGPVTYPAYDGATAGVRSLTDIYYRHRLGYAIPTTQSTLGEPGDHSQDESRVESGSIQPISHEEFMRWATSRASSSSVLSRS